jgi:hypothetical protein
MLGPKIEELRIQRELKTACRIRGFPPLRQKQVRRKDGAPGGISLQNSENRKAGGVLIIW